MLQIASSTPVSAFSTVALVLLFLLYPSITLQATRPIACIEAEDGKTYIANDMSLECGTSQHNTFVGLAFLQLVLITWGLPLLSAYIIFKRRKRLDTDSVQRRFSFLYNGYSRSAPWYETILMLKKAALVFVGSFLVGADSSNLRIFWGLLILLTALILHLILEPFPDRMQLNLESFSLVLSIFMLLSGSVFSDEEGTNSAVNISLVVLNVTATVAFLGWAMTLASVDAWKKAKETAIGEKLASKVAENALSRKLAATGQSAMAKIGNRISQSMGRSFSLFSGPSGAKPITLEMAVAGGGVAAPARPAASSGLSNNEGTQRERRKYTGLLGDIAEMLGINPVVADSTADTAGLGETDSAAMRRYSALKAEVAKWRSKTHPTTKTEFWFNTSARDLSYTKPACVEELEVMQADIAKAWLLVPHATGKWRMYQNSITGELRGDRPHEMPHTQLEAWEVRSHPSFHVPYFVNTRTDDVAWKAPAGWVPTKAHLEEIERIKTASYDSDSEGSDDGLFGDDVDEPAPASIASSSASSTLEPRAQVSNPLHAAQQSARKQSLAIPAGKQGKPSHVGNLSQTYKHPPLPAAGSGARGDETSPTRANAAAATTAAPRNQAVSSVRVSQMRTLFEEPAARKASVPERFSRR